MIVFSISCSHRPSGTLKATTWHILLPLINAFQKNKFLPAGQKGFGSLVEIIVAAVIIFIGILGTFMVLRSGHREIVISKEYIVGASLAVEIAEKLKPVPFEQLDTTAGFVDVATIPHLGTLQTPPEDLVDVERLVNIEEEENVKIISIRVVWKTKGKEKIKGATGKCEFLFYRTPFL